MQSTLLKILYIVAIILLIPTDFTYGGTILGKPPTINNIGLVGHWTMDGKDTVWTSATAATTLDKSGQGNTGTLTNMAQATAPTIGKIGQGLLFDGSNDKLAVNGPAITNTHSISFWLRPQIGPDPQWSAIIVNNSLSPYDGIFFKNITRRISYYFSGDHLSNTALNVGQWYHVAISVSSGSVTFYLNGVADGTTTGANAWTIRQIGSDNFSEHLKGTLDDVRVYNRALSASEISALYNAGEAKFAKTPTNSLTDGLVGHWTFDGKDTVWTSATAATTLDKSGEGNTGTLTSMAQATAPVMGKIGQGLKFDGSNDWVNFSADPMGTNTVTISLWINPSSLPAQGTIVSNHISAMYFAVISNGQLSLTNNAGTNKCASGVGTIVVNRWQYVTAIRNSDGTCTMYINGVQSGAAGQSAGVPASATTLAIGSRGTTAGFHFNGTIDDVRIYNRSLSASEITALYNAGEAKFAKTPTDPLTNGLVGHWTFDGKDTVWTSATAATTLDKSGQGNTGTLTSMAQATAPAIGKIGQGLNFDGGDDYVAVPEDSLVGATEFTISAWINPRSRSDFAGIVTSRGTETFIFSLSGASDGNDDLDLWSDEGLECETGNQNVITNNVWQHVVVAYDGVAGTCGIYVNGINRQTGSPSTHGSFDLNDDIKIGQDDIGGRWFDGIIDEVRIYSRALSASEITQLYNMGR